MARKVSAEKYRKAARKLTDAAVSLATASIADIGELDHDSVLPVIEPILEATTDDMAVLGMEFYNSMRTIQLGETLDITPESRRVLEATSTSLYAFENMADSRERYASLVQERVGYELRNALYASMHGYGTKDPVTPRWARVPSFTPTLYKPWKVGASHNKDVALYGTCAFCNMLASRGFVYLSEERALGRNHVHDDCDCVPVPGWDLKELRGRGRRLGSDIEIAGYDPEELYDRYLADLESGRISISDVAKANGYTQADGTRLTGAAARYQKLLDWEDWLDEAKSMEELEMRAAAVMSQAKLANLTDKNWHELRRRAKRAHDRLLA